MVAPIKKNEMTLDLFTTYESTCTCIPLFLYRIHCVFVCEKETERLKVRPINRGVT